MKGCLLVFCGLPASGKSTLISEFCASFSREFNILVVDYDKLMPPETEKHLIESSKDAPLWKEYRESIVACVDKLLSGIVGDDSESNTQHERENPLQKFPENSYLLKSFKHSRSEMEKSNETCINSDLEITYNYLELVATLSNSSNRRDVKLGLNWLEHSLESSNYMDCLKQEHPETEPDVDSEVKVSEQSKLMESVKHGVNSTDCMRQGLTSYNWTDCFELQSKVVKVPAEDCQSVGVRRGIIVMVDDNMYYSSMRYDYYQLAKKYSLGFGEVLLECPVEVALERNGIRKCGKVTDKVIMEMAAKMECPDSTVNHWEKYSVHLSPDTPDKCNEVLKIVNSAMDDPVIAVVEDTAAKAESRRICSASMVHQSDQILRKLLAIKMKSAKERGLSKLEMKTCSAKLADIKATILDNMRSGVITFDLEVTEASKDENSEFFKCVSSIFEKEISHIL